MSDSDIPIRYFATEEAIFRALRAAGFEPKLVFDIGSSLAEWSRVMGAVFPKAQFFLFEPLVGQKPLYEEGSLEAIEMMPSSRLFKIAFADYDGEQTMYTDPSGYSSSLLLTEPVAAIDRGVVVTVSRIDTFLEREKLPVPDLIKIDVQGAELLILKGAGRFLPKIQVIQLETWFSRGYGPETPLFHEIYAFLAEHGFLLFEIGSRFYNEKHELYSCDVFFAQNDLLTRLMGALAQADLTTDGFCQGEAP
jgi:FkbM family methyltransferase